MVNWLSVRKDPIEAVEHGLATGDATIETGFTGPVNRNAMRYPVGQVLPQSTSRADATNWQHSIFVNLYYDRGTYDTELGDSEYVEVVLHDVDAVLTSVLDELGSLPKVTNYHPSRIEDYAGELDNVSVLMVSIEFECMTSVDPGTFD